MIKNNKLFYLALYRKNVECVKEFANIERNIYYILLINCVTSKDSDTVMNFFLQ